MSKLIFKPSLGSLLFYKFFTHHFLLISIKFYDFLSVQAILIRVVSIF